MDNSLKILLLEDSQSDADLLIRFLNREKIKFSHTRVWNKHAFTKEIQENHYDLIIADHTLPQFTGMDAFRIVKAENKNIPFILVTGTVSEKLLTEYAKEGIDDYILKENLLRLPSAIDKVLSKKKIEKLNAQLSETNHKLNGAYSDIKNSIDYAKIIQNAMLPETAILEDAFSNSFIFFRPKDVLSGDFFWFQKKADTFFIAVADCTGHGVPGALLSMMGYNLLNEAVNIKKIVKPSEILKRLNRRTRKILAKDETTLINDGMDIAFCTINIKDNTMMYAGANRPLVIIRNNELMDVSPDKISIGGMQKPNVRFTNQSIDIQKGDTLFLFSDGYADQFGGEFNKKLTSKKFKEMLLSIQHKTLQEQGKHLETFIDSWKANAEQIDDMLVIGIKI